MISIDNNEKFVFSGFIIIIIIIIYLFGILYYISKQMGMNTTLH